MNFYSPRASHSGCKNFHYNPRASVSKSHDMPPPNHVRYHFLHTPPVKEIQSFSELCFIKMIKTFTNTLFLGYGYICTNVSS